MTYPSIKMKMGKGTGNEIEAKKNGLLAGILSGIGYLFGYS